MDEKIVEVCRLQQERAAHNYQIACAKEDRIRNLLQVISAGEKPADQASVSAMKITGYEAQWRVWSDKRRIILNQKLALCLAHKEQKRNQLATRLAELNAQNDLLENSQIKRRQLRLRSDFASQQRIMLLHAVKQ